VNLIVKLILAFAISAAVSMQVRADSTLEAAVRAEIAKKYPGARVELSAPTLGDGLGLARSVSGAKLIQENGGVAEFAVTLPNGSLAAGRIPFRASVSTFVANRRIRPGERLSKSDFALQSVTVSQGLSREYRTLMLRPDADLEKLEARQTILEGQYPLSSGVQKVPDVRRGDSVQIRLVSGAIELVTGGIAQEPASLGAPVRVLIGKTKKELLGKALENGVVEVRL